MCFYVDEYADVYNEHVRKARKPHKCVECLRTIPAGDRYLFASGISNGPFTSKMCGACELDRYRIHIHELGEGCRWSRSWCPTGELVDYMADAEIEHSTPAEGQQFLQFRERRRELYTAAFRERRGV